ncbi:NEP1-interacting protein-like 1 isoform X1 [Nymphaea colorata]|nr:NEP1-interacting protein-like 1 isoform X1 [Nymphaea colorata]
MDGDVTASYHYVLARFGQGKKEGYHLGCPVSGLSCVAEMENSSMSASSSVVGEEMVEDGHGRNLSALLRRTIYAIFTCLFVTVGFMLGALIIILEGKSENVGFLHGVGVGALSGAIISMEILDSSLAFLNSHPSRSRATLFLVIKFSCRCASRKFIQERVVQAIYAALPRQVNELDDVLDIFETETHPCGMSSISLEQLGRMKFDAAEKDGDTNSTCAICLQAFQQEEIIRRLPLCKHIFHLPCIDTWLSRHNSCPLCRQQFGEHL